MVVSSNKAPTVEVYRRLHDAVVSGEFEPGTHLAEVRLATMYGVSRTPIREALRRLEQDGLVERGPRGMVVRTRSVEEILDIYDVRIMLERAAARAAAERHRPIDLIRLERAYDAMADLAATDPVAMAEANRRFHEQMWAASHNATLIDMLGRLNDYLARYPSTTLTQAGRWSEVLAEYKHLIEAIARRDAEAAGEAAEQHMTKARDIRLQMFTELD